MQPMLRGQAALVAACLALCCFSTTASRAEMVANDSQITINPIQVCDNTGQNCGNPNRELYLAETDKIWRQAGIDVKFLDWKVMRDSNYLHDVNVASIAGAAGNQEMDGTIINMWFVNSTEAGAFGWEWGGDVLIGNNVFSYAGGAGRRDTIAHELGHALGLPHIPAFRPENLMEVGNERLAVTDISQIYPSGDQLGQLTGSQIDIARDRNQVLPLVFGIPGDANQDGEVDQSDMSAFLSGWGYSQQDPDLQSWRRGDFNLDAIVDLRDAHILQTALNGLQTSIGSFHSPVPEPSSLLLAAITIALLGWRTRCMQLR